ncbi:MAG TPA: CAP domain-containing protein [Thermoanaerobaculia bacterium]|nr:CAP domain-containing protein [Thermoanaerobaculia bacterium]
MHDAPCRFFLLAICLSSAFACPSPSSSRPNDRSASAAGSDVRPAGGRFPRASRNAAPSRALPQTAVTREEMILAFNAERTRAGVSPLRADPALEQVAQERADAIARKGGLPSEAEAPRLLGAVQRRLVQAGYTAHGWVESIVASDGDPGQVIAYWRGDPSFADMLRADYSDLGLGVAKIGDTPLYLMIVAWPEQEIYSREVRGLGDLAAVRAEMLAGVNRLRAEAGVPPLVENDRLDAAAQDHAEDMLSRGYYDHKSPEGKQVGDRLAAEGYSWRLAAENLAAGHVTVASVLDAWMQSSGHRANLLRPNVTDFGFGLAVGPFDSRYRVLWVQTFAAPLPSSSR